MQVTDIPNKASKRVLFGYGLNYLIDMEHAVIVDVEAAPARTYDEVVATKTMIKRTEQTQGLKPKRLVADTAYGTGKFLGRLVGTGITPHIPVWDKSSREDGTLSCYDFMFDRERTQTVAKAIVPFAVLSTEGLISQYVFSLTCTKLNIAPKIARYRYSRDAFNAGVEAIFHGVSRKRCNARVAVSSDYYCQSELTRNSTRIT